MEHEVFVPFPVETVRQALADPARVARCVPGLQQDADEVSDGLAGRLRLRIGGSTITYRGTLRVTGREDGELAVEGEGAEARGTGSAELAMTVRLSAADGGTTLRCAGTVRSEGRLAETSADVAAAAGRRLLDRFAAALAAGLEERPIGPAPVGRPGSGGEQRSSGGERRSEEAAAAGTAGGAATEGETAGGTDEVAAADAGDASGLADETEQDDEEATSAVGRPDDNERAIPGIPSPEKSPESPEDPEKGAEETSARGPEPEAGAPAVDDPLSVFDTEVPPPSLDPLSEEDVEDLIEEPPAEAAHARRTMIGRSAEEVDHAPPRGRYAPVPAPEATSAAATLRWAAPAAAVVLASAVVLGRVLRRRR